jgi:hypothetical protein
MSATEQYLRQQLSNAVGIISDKVALAAAASLTGLVMLAPGAIAGNGAPSVTAAPAKPGCLPAGGGYLRARLRGASTFDIEWRGVQLQCDGGPRPDRHGIRLTFAGIAEPGHHHLRFIFGIDTVPKIGNAREVPADVTVIFEGEQRLYSTRGGGQCTVDTLRQQAVGTGSARHPPMQMQVSARGFCIGPADSLESAAGGNGNGSAAAGKDAASGAATDQLIVSRFDFVGVLRELSADTADGAR